MNNSSSVRRVYDILGQEYNSRAHQTVHFFHGVQRLAIMLACIKQAQHLQMQLDEVDVLNVGVGDGQQRRDLCILCKALYNQRVKDSRLVDLDVSEVMLKVASQLYPDDEQYLNRYEDGRKVRQIVGDATVVSIPFSSFDIIIGALVDHIVDQEALYRQVYQALRPRGIFIVTYPHRNLMKVIRRKIYGIDIDYTRFIISGREYLLPSCAFSQRDVRQLMRKTGFWVSTCRTLRLRDGWYPEVFKHHSEHPFSPTMWKAKKLMGLRPSQIPVLTFSVGQKSE